MLNLESFYFDIILEINKIVEHSDNNLAVLCEKSKMVSFALSVMKNIVAYCSRFPIKLTFCIAFG